MDLIKMLEDKIAHNLHTKQFEDAIKSENLNQMMALLRIDEKLDVNTVIRTEPKGRLTPLRIVIDKGSLADMNILLQRGVNEHLKFDRLYFGDPEWELESTSGLQYALLRGRYDLLCNSYVYEFTKPNKII